MPSPKRANLPPRLSWLRAATVLTAPVLQASLATAITQQLHNSKKTYIRMLVGNGEQLHFTSISTSFGFPIW